MGREKEINRNGHDKDVYMVAAGDQNVKGQSKKYEIRKKSCNCFSPLPVYAGELCRQSISCAHKGGLTVPSAERSCPFGADLPSYFWCFTHACVDACRRAGGAVCWRGSKTFTLILAPSFLGASEVIKSE